MACTPLLSKSIPEVLIPALLSFIPIIAKKTYQNDCFYIGKPPIGVTFFLLPPACYTFDP